MLKKIQINSNFFGLLRKHELYGNPIFGQKHKVSKQSQILYLLHFCLKIRLPTRNLLFGMDFSIKLAVEFDRITWLNWLYLSLEILPFAISFFHHSLFAHCLHKDLSCKMYILHKKSQSWWKSRNCQTSRTISFHDYVESKSQYVKSFKEYHKKFSYWWVDFQKCDIQIPRWLGNWG